jgi:phosphogluconate dehydratase
VMRFQGPRANGMPELHKLMPPLGVLQDRGFRVGLVTDGRLSGASGKVISAIHVTPEAAVGGPLAKVRDGDVIVIDPERGCLEARADLAAREAAVPDLHTYHVGLGRELFTTFRAAATGAEEGATTFGLTAVVDPPDAAEPEPDIALVTAEEGV